MSSETGFWNFRFKLILLIALLMAGTLSVQAVIRNHSIQVILDGTEEVAAGIANVAAQMMLIATSTSDPAEWYSGAVEAGSDFFENSSQGQNVLVFNTERIIQLTNDLRAGLMARRALESEVPSQKGGYAQAVNMNELLLDLLVAFQPDLNSGVLEGVRKSLPYYDSSSGLVSNREELKAKDVPASVKIPGGAYLAEFSVSFAPPEGQVKLHSSDSSHQQVSASDSSDRKVPATEEFAGLGDFPVIATEFRGDPDSLSIDLEAPLEELAELVRETNERDLLATLSIFMIGLALAWILGSRLVQPVTEVVEGMQKVAAGDMSVRLSGERDAEFALINGQFNEMVQQLDNARSLERGLEHRERLQTMGDLAAGVAHDIRNPLSAISMIVGRLGFDYAPTDAKEREEFLGYTKDIKDEIERLNNLVSDFLQLAQPNSQEAVPCQVGGLLEELQRLLDNEASDQGVSIELDVQEDLAETLWNPVEGKSAFLNVAMNAIQAMQSNGGSLAIQARSDDHWIVVSFKDNGPGIAREDCEQVMLPYVTRRPGGTGLGLAIARRVAERYGGRLELTSQIAVGTEVRFMLPVSTEEGRA
ncbi:MAG: sensor histidine kinase [Planctomycetota bacterium]